MAPPKIAGKKGKTTVQTKPLTACPLGERCHVNAPDLTQFGTKFPKSHVSTLASSSVLLRDVTLNSAVGSGTLVTWAPPRGVVLCSLHETNSSSVTDLEVWLFAESTAATAPKGTHNGPSGGTWTSGTLLETGPHGRCTKVLESGAPIPGAEMLDFQFIEFNVTKSPTPTPNVAKPGTNITAEIILIAHPMGEPTQGSVAKMVKPNGPDPMVSTGDSYIYVQHFDAINGSSGGGMFNSNDELIGVYKGKAATDEHVGLNLGLVASRAIKGTTILQGWMKGSGTP